MATCFFFKLLLILPIHKLATKRDTLFVTKSSIKAKEYHTTISPWKHDWLKEEELSSLPEGKWAVAESQRRMTQDEVKLNAKVQCPEKRVCSWEEELSSLPEGEWAVAESQRGMTQDEVKNCMPRCNALKNGHLPEGKCWALYQRVSELLLSPKKGWRREREEWRQDRRRK